MANGIFSITDPRRPYIQIIMLVSQSEQFLHYMWYQKKERSFVYQNMDSVCLNRARNSRRHPKKLINKKCKTLTTFQTKIHMYLVSKIRYKWVCFTRKMFKKLTTPCLTQHCPLAGTYSQFCTSSLSSRAVTRNLEGGPSAPRDCKWNLENMLITSHSAHGLIRRPKECTCIPYGNAFNHGPPIFCLYSVYVYMVCNSSHWFCTRLPTVFLSRTVDLIVLFCLVWALGYMIMSPPDKDAVQVQRMPKLTVNYCVSNLKSNKVYLWFWEPFARCIL